MEQEGKRPTWAQISIPSLLHNYRVIRGHLSGDVRLMTVVKANAYGHGAVECAKALESAGADWFGVALVEEGIALREGGIRRPIFCLGGFWRGQAGAIIEYNLTPAVYKIDAVEELNARAGEAGRTVDVHLKVDTGMGRLGVGIEDVPAFARLISVNGNLKLDGVLTHFADADSVETGYTNRQIELFHSAVNIVKSLGFDPRYEHMAGSAGVHAHRRGWGNLARAGAALYGLTRDVLTPAIEPWDLRPVMSLHTRIIYLKSVPPGTAIGYGRTFVTQRESRIATLPVGYADGLRRAHSNNGRVIVRGRRAPIVGRVSMDLTLVDVTDVDGVRVGDEAVLLGGQGSERISAEDLAVEEGTVSYEVVCGVSARVPRIYLRPRVY
ncbi:MAG: alanine racemase [Blastocatellales bacterium]|nr:alanine racemase [Blastocatellales bacterium]